MCVCVCVVQAVLNAHHKGLVEGSLFSFIVSIVCGGVVCMCVSVCVCVERELCEALPPPVGNMYVYPMHSIVSNACVWRGICSPPPPMLIFAFNYLKLCLMCVCVEGELFV